MLDVWVEVGGRKSRERKLLAADMASYAPTHATSRALHPTKVAEHRKSSDVYPLSADGPQLSSALYPNSPDGPQLLLDVHPKVSDVYPLLSENHPAKVDKHGFSFGRLRKQVPKVRDEKERPKTKFRNL